MLKHEVEEIDLYSVFETFWPEIEAGLSDELRDDIELIAQPSAAVSLEYPSQKFPSKVSSFNLDKNPLVQGQLDAIKGQFDDIVILSIRPLKDF